MVKIQMQVFFVTWYDLHKTCNHLRMQLAFDCNVNMLLLVILHLIDIFYHVLDMLIRALCYYQHQLIDFDVFAQTMVNVMQGMDAACQPTFNKAYVTSLGLHVIVSMLPCPLLCILIPFNDNTFLALLNLMFNIGIGLFFRMLLKVTGLVHLQHQQPNDSLTLNNSPES